jgi:hypothetical protein
LDVQAGKMTRPAILGLMTALALTLTGCGDASAPAGRWEGFSQSAKWLVAVRLQVDKGNVIHATALSVSVDGVSLPKRLELTNKIKASLVAQWPMAVEGKIDFKDNTITKAGGYAPLFLYDPKSHAMTFNFYAGGRLTEKIKLYPVKSFAAG